MSAGRTDALGKTALNPLGRADAPRGSLPTASLARTSKCAFLGEPASSALCDPWTIHSLRLFVRGFHLEEALASLRGACPGLRVYRRPRVNRMTGEVFLPRAVTQLDLADLNGLALLPLSDVASVLQRFPWSEHPNLRVNRIDLASDHLVSPDPREVCDRIAGLRLPYSRPYRGPRNAEEPWLTIYHNGGKARVPGVVVAHYPRLESLLYRHPEAGAAAVRYAEHRVRQEIRFRGQGLRRRVGDGPMALDVVLGSFPALLNFAARRLRPVFEAGILSPPPRDLEGEAALASAVGSRLGPW